MEVGDDALGHHFADALYLLQFLEPGIHQGIDVLEMTGQQTGRCLSHEPDAESKDDAFERHLLRSGDAIDYFLCRLCA